MNSKKFSQNKMWENYRALRKDRRKQKKKKI